MTMGRKVHGCEPFNSLYRGACMVPLGLLESYSHLCSSRLYTVGPCITTVFPGDVCPLDALVGECDENLSATNCICGEGFKYQRTQCIGKFLLKTSSKDDNDVYVHR